MSAVEQTANRALLSAMLIIASMLNSGAASAQAAGGDKADAGQPDGETDRAAGGDKADAEQPGEEKKADSKQTQQAVGEQPEAEKDQATVGEKADSKRPGVETGRSGVGEKTDSKQPGVETGRSGVGEKTDSKQPRVVVAEPTDGEQPRTAVGEKTDREQPPNAAKADSRNRTSGVALGLGLGYEYVLLGVQALYYIRLSAFPLFITPHAGMGIFEVVGYCLGMSAALGFRHRIMLDVSYGAIGYEKLYLHGAMVDERATYGMQGGVGYEYMSDGGFLMRALVGGAYPADARLGDSQKEALFTLSFGIGWKVL